MSKRYAMTEAESDSERWFVALSDKWGDVSDALDSDLDEGTRRVSDWELVTVADRFNGHVESRMRTDAGSGPFLPSRPLSNSTGYFSILYVWRCRIVDVEGAE